MDVSKRIRVQRVETLADDWYILKKTTFDFQRADGSWQTLSRETYDRGNGATILLYNQEQQTVILTRQFRYPAYVNGHHGLLIETCAGLLEEADPQTRIRQEAEEETGYSVRDVELVFTAFMSPGSVTERLFFLSVPTRQRIALVQVEACERMAKISVYLNCPSRTRSI